MYEKNGSTKNEITDMFLCTDIYSLYPLLVLNEWSDLLKHGLGCRLLSLPLALTSRLQGGGAG